MNFHTSREICSADRLEIFSEIIGIHDAEQYEVETEVLKPMNLPLERTALGEGLYFNSVRDQRFHKNLLTVNFILPLCAQTAGENALVLLMLEKGSKTYPTFRALSKKLDLLYGAAVSVNTSKVGDRQVLSVSISAIDDRYALAGEPLLRETAKLLCDLIANPVLTEQNFTLQKEYLLDAIRAELNEKRTYALNQTIALMYQNEPFGVSRYGTAESVGKLTLEAAKEAYQRILKQARVEIFHVGMGDPTGAQQIFADLFSGLDRLVLPEIAPNSALREGGLRQQTERFDVTQSKLCLGFRTGMPSNSDLLWAMRMMVAILGGTPMSKFFLNVREKLSLCYYCAARYDRSKGMLLVDSGVEHDKIEEAKTAILHEIEEMKAGNFTDEEMGQALSSLQNTYRSVAESAYGVQTYYVTQYMEDGHAYTPEEQCEKLQSVTRSQIVEAANLLRLDTVYLLTGEEGGEA